MSRRGHNQVRSNNTAKSNGHTTSRRPIAVHHGGGRSVEPEWAKGFARRVEAKAHLFAEGDARNCVYKVASGAICLYKVLSDGRRQVIGFAFEGDVIGLDAAPVETCSAQAIGSTRLQCLPLVMLLKAAKHDTGVALALYEALSCELAATREHLSCVGHRDATERLANFLVMLSRKYGVGCSDPQTIELRMTRSDIADYLGLTIETVSRTFSKLKAQRLIEIDQVTKIRLTNVGQLERLADGHRKGLRRQIAAPAISPRSSRPAKAPLHPCESSSVSLM